MRQSWKSNFQSLLDLCHGTKVLYEINFLKHFTDDSKSYLTDVPDIPEDDPKHRD